MTKCLRIWNRFARPPEGRVVTVGGLFATGRIRPLAEKPPLPVIKKRARQIT